MSEGKIYYYNNGKHEIRLHESDNVPDGYVRGRINLYKSTGQRWVNNSVIEFQIKSGEDVPNGFSLGRIKRSAACINKHKNTYQQRGFKWYTNGKEEILLPSNLTPPNGYEPGRLKMSSLQKQKLSKSHTGLKQTEETRKKISEHSNNNREKAKQTCLSRYGVDCVAKVPSVIEKAVESKLKAGTFNTSNPENELYNKLVAEYCRENVVRNYKDKIRYPFRCDFYIKSEDLFIELNAHWTHGGRPWNPDDPECQKQLAIWQEKANISKFYQEAIITWTVRDVKKAQTAKENNLNYVVIY